MALLLVPRARWVPRGPAAPASSWRRPAWGRSGGRSPYGGGTSTSRLVPTLVACRAAPTPSPPLAEGGKGWTVLALKAELKRLGLSQAGKKADLVARLLGARGATQGQEAAAASPAAALGSPGDSDPEAAAAPKRRTLYVDWSSTEDAAASEKFSLHFDAIKQVVDVQFPGEYRVVPRGGYMENGSFELYLDDASVPDGQEPTLVYSTLCIGRLPDPHMDVLQNLMVFMARERRAMSGVRESAGG